VWGIDGNVLIVTPEPFWLAVMINKVRRGDSIETSNYVCLAVIRRLWARSGPWAVCPMTTLAQPNWRLAPKHEARCSQSWFILPSS